MANGNEGQSAKQSAVDDRGTSSSQGRELLKALCESGFEGNEEKLAVALGRPVEEVKGWLDGSEVVDDDVIMKARGIAMHRSIRVD